MITDLLHKQLEKELGHSNYRILETYQDLIFLSLYGGEERGSVRLTETGRVKKNSFRTSQYD
jgi:hypothetical protein